MRKKVREEYSDMNAVYQSLVSDKKMLLENETCDRGGRTHG